MLWKREHAKYLAVEDSWSPQDDSYITHTEIPKGRII